MYYLERLFEVDWKKMFTTIGKISKRSKKLYIYILIDVIICSFKYGAGYMDYFQFFFENLNSYQRSTYINRTVNNRYYKALNDSSYYHIFNNKHEFLDKYNKFIKRDYCLIDDNYEGYLKFVEKHKVFIAKPDNGLCGIGVELVDASKEDLKSLYDRLVANKQNLLEERIIQNKELSKLYPEAINTLRIVTINKNGKITIPFTCIRVGTGGRHVDNFHAGGVFSRISEEGIITKPALDKENRIFEVHPDTGVRFEGFKIPMYKEVLEQCKQMAAITPEVGYMGWDMAITDKGIDVVEANQLPGYDLYQSYPHLGKDLIGLKPEFDKAIYG